MNSECLGLQDFWFPPHHTLGLCPLVTCVLAWKSAKHLSEKPNGLMPCTIPED